VSGAINYQLSTIHYPLSTAIIFLIGAIRGLMVEWEKSPDVSYGLSDTEGASLATGGFHS